MHTENSNWYKAMLMFEWSVKRLRREFIAPDAIIQRIHAEVPPEHITRQIVNASQQMISQIGF